MSRPTGLVDGDPVENSHGPVGLQGRSYARSCPLPATRLQGGAEADLPGQQLDAQLRGSPPR